MRESRSRVLYFGTSESNSKWVSQLKRRLTAPDFFAEKLAISCEKRNIMSNGGARNVRSRSRVFLSWRIGIEIKMCKSAQKAIGRTKFSVNDVAKLQENQIPCQRTVLGMNLEDSEHHDFSNENRMPVFRLGKRLPAPVFR